MQERLLHDPEALARFVFAMSGGSGQLFADAAFFRVFRTHVVPLLRTYSFARMWVPSCASGEDAYSLAVLLQEEGLLERSMIYATDASDLAIAAARAGTFEFEANGDPVAAHRSGGARRSLSEFADCSERSLTFGDELKRHIIFAKHNLVTDGSLNEFHVIVRARRSSTLQSLAAVPRAQSFPEQSDPAGLSLPGVPSESLRHTPH